MNNAEAVTEIVNEKNRIEFREKARKFERSGCINKDFGNKIIRHQIPAPYDGIVGLTYDELLSEYGSKVLNLVSFNSALTTTDIDAAIKEQMAADKKIMTEMLYDPCAKEDILYGEFINKYGASAAEEAEDNGDYEPETKKAMRNKHRQWLENNNQGEVAEKVHQSKTHLKARKKPAVKIGPTSLQTGSRYFLKTTRGLIYSPEYREIFKEKGCSIIFEYMWAHIVRKQWNDTPDYPIKEKYYNNGLLAYCSSYRYLARKCGLDKNYIHKVLHQFHKKEIIKLDMIVPKGKKFGQMVAILGEWKSVDNVIEEKLYRDHVFVSEAK